MRRNRRGRIENPESIKLYVRGEELSTIVNMRIHVEMAVFHKTGKELSNKGLTLQRNVEKPGADLAAPRAAFLWWGRASGSGTFLRARFGKLPGCHGPP